MTCDLLLRFPVLKASYNLETEPVWTSLREFERKGAVGLDKSWGCGFRSMKRCLDAVMKTKYFRETILRTSLKNRTRYFYRTTFAT